MDETSKLLWAPSEEFKANSNLAKYMTWLEVNRNLNLETYKDLWEWSTSNISDFWESIWDYFEVEADGKPNEVVAGYMPEAKWFQGTALNYAEHIFRKASDNPAIIFKSETTSLRKISWLELRQHTENLQGYLTSVGVSTGDRVAAYLPSIPEATTSFLAANATGAVWSSCSPDFGLSSIIDRFAQIEPKVLIAVDGYRYGGKEFNKLEIIQELQKAIPSIEQVILIPYLNPEEKGESIHNCILWSEAINTPGNLHFERVPFEHPIWVLYSSGTTGIPKAITHSHGGVLLEHLKYLALHNNVKPGDNCFWYTTTGWMMWNYIQASLLCGGTMVLYDGSPAYPDMNCLWQFAEEASITHFGTSAGFVVANMKADTHPGKDFDLSALQSIGSTGSPLPPEGFDWIYNEIKEDLWLASISGGTDVCSAFVGGNPLTPVYSGEIQCRALGCKLESFDEDGGAVINQVGEMVVTEPMPSMPVYFWNDPNFDRYKSSYFEMFPGIWRHGDWTMITPRDGVIILGRSDSTLNRGGVRIGTSEIYRAVDKIEEVADSLIICLEKGTDYYMPLFVVMAEGHELSEETKKKINTTIRSEYTPRHIPDEIIAISEVPYTISGKKVETPVKKILLGKATSQAINPDALKNPEALSYFEELSTKLDLQ